MDASMLKALMADMKSKSKGSSVEVEVEPAEEESEDEDYTAAAGEIMAAIESKDAGALATALKAFVSAC
jgi:hypothetical protein